MTKENEYKINQFFHRNYIITGIPRSGTSLLSTIMNCFDNCVCLNEVMDNDKGINFYATDLLPGMFNRIRSLLWDDQAIPNRYDKDGKLTTNTMADGENLKWKSLQKLYDHNIFIGSKINAPYLFELPRISFNGFNIMAVIRDPRYTIGSYQMPYTQTLNITNCLTDNRYSWFEYKNEYAKLFRKAQEREDVICDEDMRLARIHSQAEIWNFFANQIYQLREFITIVKYEELVNNTEMIIKEISRLFNLSIDMTQIPEIYDGNKKEYPYMNEIEKAVDLYCKIRGAFEY